VSFFNPTETKCYNENNIICTLANLCINSKITIDANALKNLFLALSKKKLIYLNLVLCPTVHEKTTSAELE